MDTYIDQLHDFIWLELNAKSQVKAKRTFCPLNIADLGKKTINLLSDLGE